MRNMHLRRPTGRSGRSAQLLPIPCPRLPPLPPLNPCPLPLPLPPAPAGLQNLLLLCIARIAVLLCIGSATCRALYHRRTAHSPPVGASPRSASLVQAAICLQLVWLAAEVLLGSVLLLSRPSLHGEERGGAVGFETE